MKETIYKITADIKYTSLYTCNKCGIKQEGASNYYNIKQVDYNTILHLLYCRKLDSNNMPIGWSSSHSPQGTLYTCIGCGRD